MAKLCSYLIFLSLSLNYYFFTCLAMSRKNITTDEYSLLAFKSFITLDPYDPMVHNWSTSSSVCNWVGVTCDEQHGRVHALNLSNMGLKGTISPQLGNLSFLVHLDFQGNAFNGELPQSLFQLHRLKLLNLSNNMLSGTIPQMISNLSSLEEITLANNSLSGMWLRFDYIYCNYIGPSVNFTGLFSFKKKDRKKKKKYPPILIKKIYKKK